MRRFFLLCIFRSFLAVLCRDDDDLWPIGLGPNLCAVHGSLGDVLYRLPFRFRLFQSVLDDLGHIRRYLSFRRFRCPTLALALFWPDFRQYARLEADFEGSLLDTYRVLRTTNPSPYMFYFSSDDVEIAGASPETLVKVEDGEVRTFPLAGTRPRGKSYEEDQRLEKELLADEKERAEHNMLVDLGRNDLGKICDFGTVEVEKYMSIERYSHVMHIGSTVKGQLRKDKTAVDAIDSVLPAGTLSGAPKLRACQIINELENNKRGIYGGAIGYLDFTGNMDTCIAIRLAFKKNGKVFVRSGAGIVADSVPEKEYQECINKAKAVMVALAEAEGGSNL